MNVLVLEDDESIRQIFRYMFRGKGHEVVYTEHLTEAEAQLAGIKDCALLITDFQLPEGYCTEFVRQFRTKFPKAGVLVVTGAHGIADELRGTSGLEHCGVLHKPFDMDAGYQVIEKSFNNYGNGAAS